MVMVGTSRRSRVSRTLVVVLQVFLLLFSAVGPVATYAADPDAERRAIAQRRADAGSDPGAHGGTDR